MPTKVDMHYRIVRTAAFIEWMDGLKDRKGQTIIARRIERMACGNLGDVKALGGELMELRIAFGPGYRIYFTFDGEDLVILLCGGDKGSQGRDIAAARRMLIEED